MLRQFARYCESNEPVSAVTVRMGTGDVGLAFTNCRTMHIPDFDQLGGTFAEAMRRLGLEDQEISAHSQRQRKSFYSVPIVDRERHRRMGVLSFDAIPPRFFVEHRSALRRGATREHLVPLLDQIEVAGFLGRTLPDDGVVRDEVAPESDDSAPRGRPPTPRPR